MTAVGIKELKSKLSTYIKRVHQGEIIVVTDHGKEVALLSPISSERQAIKSLLEAGKASWAGGKPSGIKGLHIEGPPLAETVLEERR
jgi:prevent-host-death family protein